VAKPSDHTRVTFHWHAIPNENKARGGWMPVVDEDGRQRGDTWGRGYDLETALSMAKQDAERSASRFVGDWDIVVEPKPGAPGVPKAKKAPKPKKALAPRSPYGEMDTASDQLPWRNSYANWTVRLGEAAAKHGAGLITYGSETHDAWRAGISPDAYAKSKAKARR